MASFASLLRLLLIFFSLRIASAQQCPASSTPGINAQFWSACQSLQSEISAALRTTDHVELTAQITYTPVVVSATSTLSSTPIALTTTVSSASPATVVASSSSSSTGQASITQPIVTTTSPVASSATSTATTTLPTDTSESTASSTLGAASSPSAASDDTNRSSHNSHYGTHVVLPAVLCSVVGAILIALLLWFFLLRRPKQHEDEKAAMVAAGATTGDSSSGDLASDPEKAGFSTNGTGLGAATGAATGAALAVGGNRQPSSSGTANRAPEVPTMSGVLEDGHWYSRPATPGAAGALNMEQETGPQHLNNQSPQTMPSGEFKDPSAPTPAQTSTQAPTSFFNDGDSSEDQSRPQSSQPPQNTTNTPSQHRGPAAITAALPESSSKRTSSSDRRRSPLSWFSMDPAPSPRPNISNPIPIARDQNAPKFDFGFPGTMPGRAPSAANAATIALMGGTPRSGDSSVYSNRPSPSAAATPTTNPSNPLEQEHTQQHRRNSSHSIPRKAVNESANLAHFTSNLNTSHNVTARTSPSSAAQSAATMTLESQSQSPQALASSSRPTSPESYRPISPEALSTRRLSTSTTGTARMSTDPISPHASRIRSPVSNVMKRGTMRSSGSGRESNTSPASPPLS